MGYFVRVQINRLVCRDPETVTTADVIGMAGAVVVDGQAHGFVLPLRRMRSGSKEDFHEVVFDGHSDAAEIGFAFAAWDKDRNGKWVDNREDIEKVKAAIATGLNQLPGGVVLGQVPEIVVRAVDFFVAQDRDDRLANLYETFSLYEASTAVRTQEFEVRFRGEEIPHFSDWDYSLFLTVTYYQPAHQLGTPELGAWQPAMETTPAAWLGAWDGGDGGRAAVSAVISAGAGAGRLKVRIEETIEGAETEFLTDGVVVSRVMVEAGRRHLDTDNLFLKKAFDDGPVGKGPAAELDHTPVLLRQQLGGDLLCLDRQAVLELHHEIRGGEIADAELRYRRPVDDVLYPEKPTLLDAVLKPRVL